MIYNGEKQLDANRAKERLNWLITKGKRFELKEKRAKRTSSQNNYLHLILSWYALEMGESLEYVKQEIFKKMINADIFRYERINRVTGEVRDDFKSTSELNTKQMTTCIDRFRNHSSKDLGIYLPEPHDMALLDQMQNEIENQKSYLY